MLQAKTRATALHATANATARGCGLPERRAAGMECRAHHFHSEPVQRRVRQRPCYVPKPRRRWAPVGVINRLLVLRDLGSCALGQSQGVSLHRGARRHRGRRRNIRRPPAVPAVSRRQVDDRPIQWLWRRLHTLPDGPAVTSIGVQGFPGRDWERTYRRGGGSRALATWMECERARPTARQLGTAKDCSSR